MLQNYSAIEYIFILLHEPSEIHDKAGDNQEILLFDVIIFLHCYVKRNFADQFF
jgi:hypothetical protein